MDKCLGKLKQWTIIFVIHNLLHTKHIQLKNVNTVIYEPPFLWMNKINQCKTLHCSLFYEPEDCGCWFIPGFFEDAWFSVDLQFVLFITQLSVNSEDELALML